VTGFEVDEKILEDLRVMGAPAEMIAAWKKAQAPEPELLLLPDVYPSVRVFDAMATQWDRAGERGVKVGFKYDRVPLFMRMLGIPPADRRQVFEDLRTLELETLRVYAEKGDA
jgi:uncharacterized protein DUF1799